MDPTKELIITRDSFTSVATNWKEHFLASGYRSNTLTTPEFDVVLSELSSLAPSADFVDIKLFNEVAGMKDKFRNLDSPFAKKKYAEYYKLYSGSKFSQRYKTPTEIDKAARDSVLKYARDQSNPFEKSGKSRFTNRAGVKIANCDGIFNFSKFKYSSGLTEQLALNKMATPRPLFSYIDVASAPGAFTEWIQWRRPKSDGFGISLKGGLGWSTKMIDMKKFKVSWGETKYGGDETGNLYTNSEAFSQEVKAKYPLGVDLAMGDGGFDVDQGDFDRQEFWSARLILTELLVSIMSLKSGGTFVCKIFDSVTKITADILYMSALCFEQIWSFKPISSRPANAERYLVCTNFKGFDKLLVKQIIQVLQQVNNNHTATKRVISFVKNLPADFVKWMKTQNQRSMERQKMTAINFLSVLAADVLAQPYPNYNLTKTYILWNIPSPIKPPSKPYRRGRGGGYRGSRGDRNRRFQPRSRQR